MLGLLHKVWFCEGSTSNGRTHGAPYRSHGYVPLRSEGGMSLWEWEHNKEVPVKAKKADSWTFSVLVSFKVYFLPCVFF